MRTTMIELLTWTYRDELPKRDRMGYGDGWGAVEAYGDGGGYDVEPMPRLPTIVGAPHPDAELVDRRVKAMDRFEFTRSDQDAQSERRRLAEHFLGPMSWHPNDAQLGAMMKPMDLRPFIQSLALGVIRPPGAEAWVAEPIRSDDRSGRVHQENVEWRTVRVRIDGQTVFKRQLVSGDCPVRWVPDPAAVMAERLRWAALCQALEELSTTLSDLLLWRVDGLGLPLEPWRGDVHRSLKGVLLPSLQPSVVSQARLSRRTRKRA